MPSHILKERIWNIELKESDGQCQQLIQIVVKEFNDGGQGISHPTAIYKFIEYYL